MRVLVTGGAGFIGSHIVEALAGAGHEPSVLDLRDGGDVRDASIVEHALRGVDVVCHQAAKVGMGLDMADAPAYASTNDVGTAVLLAQMANAGVHRLVLASSMVVYGEGHYECGTHGAQPPPARSRTDLEAGRFDPMCPVCTSPLKPGLVSEEARLSPRSLYAATKLAQENLALAWALATGGTVAALRYHNVYGPRMPRDTPYSGVAAIFRSALERGEAPRVFEDGGQLRDFIHVTDVAAANVLSLVNDRTFVAYNIASGEPHTVGEMARTLAHAFGGPAPVVTGDFRMGDVRHVMASPHRAHTELAFAARVPFADGMAAFATDPLREPQ